MSSQPLALAHHSTMIYSGIFLISAVGAVQTAGSDGQGSGSGRQSGCPVCHLPGDLHTCSNASIPLESERGEVLEDKEFFHMCE